MIEYVEIFNNNKSVEKLDSETLHLRNQLCIKRDSSALQLLNKGLSYTSIAAGATIYVVIDIHCFLTK